MAFDLTINEDNGGNINYANDNLYFTSNVTYGPILSEQINSDSMEIDGNVKKEDIIPIYFQYSINKVEKYSWKTQDGFFYSTPTIIHSFTSSGTYTLSLTIISEEQNYNGIPFRFKYTHTQNTKVTSFFYKMILKNMPMWQYEANQEMSDIVTTSARFFDRIYKDIKETYNLIDIENINPKYFEYLASTLGHNLDYAKKVGGNVNDDTFEQYDIFERIKNNIATPLEIRNFRQFLLLSVDIFRSGGTPFQIKKFLSLFSIDAKSIDLWTQYWGVKAIGLTTDNFVGYENFEDNALKLKWQNIRVVGNNNDQGHLIKNFNSIILDNYHDVQKLNYPNDIIDEDSDYAYFRIINNVPIFKDIRRENGNLIVSEDISSDYYDIITNIDSESNIKYPYILKLKTQYLEDGDRLTINYETTSENSIDSIITNIDNKVKNMDFIVKFKYLPIKSVYENTNIKNQDNEIFLEFRGTKSKDGNLYDNYNEYYRVSLNAKRSIVSLSKVVKNSSSDELITQKINLNQSDSTNPIFEKLLLNLDQPIAFKFNSAYDIKVTVIGSTVSAYYREDIEFNEIIRKIESNEGEVPFNQLSIDWIPLFENVNIDVKELNIFSTDSTGDTISSYPYNALLDEGYYGIGIRNSIIEILQASIDNLDFESSLYTDEEKELNLKPKYLEWQNNKLLSFNSYKDNKTNTFSKTISSNFDYNTKQYELKSNEAKAIKYLYFDNAPLSEEIASRYTVTFDKSWINDNFISEQDVMDKIIVPFGSQSSWFAIESRTYDRDFYKNYFGESMSTKNIGTEDVPILKDIPGYFSYNLSTTLDTYKIEPEDSFSSVSRIDVRDSSEVLIKSSFKANERIEQYKYSNIPIRMRGLFEEICPNSGLFSNDAICGNVNQDGESYENPLFFPIVINNANAQRVIGVRFKNCSDIKNIIERILNNRDEVVQAQLYGMFILQLPIESVKFRPDLNKNLEIFDGDTNTVLVKMFVPLGILNSEIQNYSLSTEYMHDIENSGATTIALDSLYVRLPREIMIYKEQENIFELPTINPYEDDEKNLKCRYYLSADLTLATNLNDYERTLEGISNKFMMNYDFRKLLDGLIKNNANINDSYLWWIPKELWRKRDFEILSLDEIADIATGLNYDTSSSKYFYGKKIDKNSEINSLRIKIKDGNINPYTTYYAKVRFRMSWNGFDELLLGNASLVDGTTKQARPLNSNEAEEVVTIGGNALKYANSMPAPVGECIEFYIPISWYPEGEVPEDNIMSWGNYIKGVAGDENSPSVSLTPYGLMTYLIMNSTNSNFKSEDIGKITSGWTIQDWNTRFMQFITIDFVAEVIPSNVFKLYDEYGFVSKYASINGAKIDIEYDAGDIKEWKVLETSTMLPKSYNSYYFKIPSQLYSLTNWVEDITSMKLSNYVIPYYFYNINSNIIQLNTDNIFNTLQTSELKARFSFDILFNESSKNTIYTDDFYKNRNINWINYQENSIKDTFELSIRSPSENLFLGGEDPLMQITSLDGIHVLKNTESTTTNVYDPLLSGISYNSNVIISKDDNGGYIKNISLINDLNDIYEIESLVWFDKKLNTLKNYNGKKFEYIIKAENSYNGNTNTFMLSSYYFVGIGTYDFDVSLGVAKYNPTTNTMEKTFLAGFGDYNTNNIKSDTWYKLKVVVDGDNIKVIFNEESESERMVIKYNIDINYQKDINKYVSGQFEELVYLVTGLDKMKITYPETLKSIAGDAFYSKNWNETWAASIRPLGPYTGIKMFNPYTYVKNVTYKARIQDDKTFTTSNELTDLNSIILEIEKNYKVDGVVENVGKTTNGSIIVKYGKDLFHKMPNRFISKKFSGVEKVYIANNKIVIKFDTSNKLSLVVVDETFTKDRTIYVKDNFFNSDHIYKYMLWTDRTIDEVYANQEKIYVTFKDN